MFMFDLGGEGEGDLFIGYLLSLENRITLCNTSFIQLPISNGCIVVLNRANFEYNHCVS